MGRPFTMRSHHSRTGQHSVVTPYLIGDHVSVPEALNLPLGLLERLADGGEALKVECVQISGCVACRHQMYGDTAE